MSHRIVGSNFDTMARETTSQPAASKALPTDLVPQKSSRSLGIFEEQDHRQCDLAQLGVVGLSEGLEDAAQPSHA